MAGQFLAPWWPQTLRFFLFLFVCVCVCGGGGGGGGGDMNLKSFIYLR